ncbi:hypothetical protein L2E82_15736 [Cichorium intybus]|uniref:Uncharacterized protein n=2 Tax=Cichorium intybus TaxID=13427 RepID=A0ACB9F3N0_CICIN|nr:hypothetical protein L2E82_33540 [Cichorium intybus]KAI3765694.1 hypothetical protein L2E82_15736 [Cichorium intybus]
MQRHYLRIQLNFPLIAEEIHELGEQVSRIIVQNQQQLSKEKKSCKALGQNHHHHHQGTSKISSNILASSYSSSSKWNNFLVKKDVLGTSKAVG